MFDMIVDFQLSISATNEGKKIMNIRTGLQLLTYWLLLGLCALASEDRGELLVNLFSEFSGSRYVTGRRFLLNLNARF
jgi:hypothetical protein